MPDSRVLVVEDDQVLRTAIADALVEEGYTVDTASSGHIALKVAESSPPDLVILDLMMPYVDGEEFSKAMRRIEGLESVPVVVVSASRKIEEVATRIGARAVLGKPFDLYELTEYVRSLLDSAENDARRQPGVR